MKLAGTKQLYQKSSEYVRHLPAIMAWTSLVLSCSRGTADADAFGNFEAVETTVSSEANGLIQRLDLQEGDPLKKGQIVGFIDTVALSLKREELVNIKQTILAKANNVLRQREVVREELRLAQTDLKRIEALFADRAATQKQVDDSRGRTRILERQIKSIESQNDPILNEVKGIEIKILQLEDQLEKCKIKSPQDGTVLLKYAQIGEVTTFGKPLFKVANLKYMELRVYFSETQLHGIRAGQSVTVKIDAGDSLKSYPGKITWISSAAEFTPKIIQTKEERVNLVYAAKVLVKNDGALKIGMPAELWIQETNTSTSK